MREDPRDPGIPGLRFERLLGSGSAGDVVLCTQEILGRSVAVKVLRSVIDDPVARERFEREARLMAALAGHRAIVSILSAGVTALGRPYIVMEYCGGPTLEEAYRRAPLSVSQVLSLGVLLASAVGAAHRAGIIHGDVKPANVLTTLEGRPLLADFGLSVSSTVGLARLEGLSLPWAAPELLGVDPLPDARSDVYAVGATLYSALAGRSPFARASATPDRDAFVGRILRDPPPPIERSDIPPGLWDVLVTALAKAPDDRGDAAAMARRLQEVERLLGLEPTPLDAVPLDLLEAPPEIDDATRLEPDGATLRPDAGSAGLAGVEEATRFESPEESTRFEPLGDATRFEPAEESTRFESRAEATPFESVEEATRFEPVEESTRVDPGAPVADASPAARSLVELAGVEIRVPTVGRVESYGIRELPKAAEAPSRSYEPPAPRATPRAAASSSAAGLRRRARWGAVMVGAVVLGAAVFLVLASLQL